jgi:LEA14-like dessication related protein
MKKILFILLVASIIMGGCANYRNIEVVGADVASVSVVSLNAVHIVVRLKVDNPTKATFEVVGTDGSIKKGGNEFAVVSQVAAQQKCTIPPGSPSVAEITLRVELTDPFSIFAGGIKLDQLTADVVIKVKQGALTRKLKVKDMPAGDLVKQIKF